MDDPNLKWVEGLTVSDRFKAGQALVDHMRDRLVNGDPKSVESEAKYYSDWIAMLTLSQMELIDAVSRIDEQRLALTNNLRRAFGIAEEGQGSGQG
ncbi:hypothetical protein PXH78_26905 [Mycolicibacterium smegmatis]|uniref:hypothetical protein n=1 Tax=Mycolicibacterium smegmatis TaxID=1772 RepID=UPI0012FF8CA7|nr:hypothetical protein [Mycolicibacterium smegmatis]MDF1902742.1 hypothetical protein [Mycolicibacterium smegmatis]MDF1909018.1 hypothetical protein [Mycolicibacterium smegmatis]MDF1921237.1 hypothetical protein [Mycolicibacterium smegmatis]MDF1927502.1 hypothetical protein [Mycolicibacterium smegmatis]UAK53359.1 hypothetical protein K8P01_22465 [Mycolicibacterium smegmatis]